MAKMSQIQDIVLNLPQISQVSALVEYRNAISFILFLVIFLYNSK